MKTRLIVLKDYKNLIRFWKSNYFVTEIDSPDRFKLFLEKNPGLSLLIEDEEKIIGSVLVSFDGRRGYIQKLVVDKYFRKQGLGKKLITKAINKLHKLGALYIPINCEVNYESFYKKIGFKKTNQVPMSLSR